MSTPKKTSRKTVAPTEETSSEERVRMAAYLIWESKTGGNPVDEETTRQFWLQAEQELTQDSPA